MRIDYNLTFHKSYFTCITNGRRWSYKTLHNFPRNEVRLGLKTRILSIYQKFCNCRAAIQYVYACRPSNDKISNTSVFTTGLILSYSGTKTTRYKTHNYCITICCPPKIALTSFCSMQLFDKGDYARARA